VAGGHADSAALALEGNWRTQGGGLRGEAGASAAFAVPSAARFYLKLRVDLSGTATLRLNGETLRLGEGLTVLPGGTLQWAALPDRRHPPDTGTRHTLEMFCQDGCLDVLWDNVSAGFGVWPPGGGLSNGVFRVESGQATLLAWEWRGPAALPSPVQSPTRAPVAPPPKPAVAALDPVPAPPAPAEEAPPRPPLAESPPAVTPQVPTPPVPAPAPATPAAEAMAESLQALRARLRRPEGITWVFAGDSITLGGHFTQGGRSYPEHFQERIRWEMRRFDDAVINAAFNGATTDTLAAALDHRVLRHRPDVVFLLIGSNDSRRGEAWLPRFRDWLETLVARLRAAGAMVILQTANHPASNRPPALLHNDTLYMAEVRATAARLGVPLIDHWALWQAYHADPDTKVTWMGDTLHPNSRGHLRMALDIFRILGLYDPASRVVRLGGDEP
jgi:lysophospholipase L1-like esterase